jgi:exodeoxyribonuclease III
MPPSKPKPAPSAPKLADPQPYTADALPKPPGKGGLRLATWNINSVRLRIELVKKLAEAAKPDVICLQEIKTEDQFFPADELKKAGYPHQLVYGMKGYNGVAILSRRPLDKHTRPTWCQKDDSRHAHAEVEGIELHNLYVPAGGDIPDPKANPKFAHKLQFLTELGDWWKIQKTTDAKRILVGDLNVAPLENDVWSHKQLLDVVSHTPVEVELLTRFRMAHGWVDTMRHLYPEPQRLYTWWSYRNRDWRLSDRGRRLDHVWVTPALLPHVKATYILKQARDWTGPSDHVPVILDLKT